jgi:hypothetical protein
MVEPIIPAEEAEEPICTTTPPSWNFGTQQMLLPSVPKTISITNTGGGSLNISSIALSGTQASQF